MHKLPFDHRGKAERVRLPIPLCDRANRVSDVSLDYSANQIHGQGDMMPVPVEHPILDRIYIQLRVIHDMNIHECVAEPMFRDIVQGSKSIEFTDDNGDWEIVVREIEGGRD